MTTPKAILFDLDDTIISFDGVSEATWDKCCDAFIEDNSTNFSAAELRSSIHRARKWYWSDPERHRAGRADIIAARRRVVKAALFRLGYIDAQKAIQMADGYSALQWESLHLFDGAIKALELIKSLGIIMALITNGTAREQRGKISRFKLEQYFDFILVEGETGFGKPDPKSYITALDKLSLSPSEVWMVGDNLVWDVQAPQSLGIFSVWNDFRNEGLPRGSEILPDKIIHSIYELAVELAKS